MNLKGVNLSELTDQQLVRLNARLPKPKQEIIGHVSVLPITVAMGCQITVLRHKDWRKWLKADTWFLLDGNKKISFPCITNNTSDATHDYLEVGGDYFCVGSASLGGRYANHVDAWYSPQFFGFGKKNILQTSFFKRRGWCCTMSKKSKLRDHVTNVIESSHMHRFDNTTWFCYDGINLANQKLIDLMFRSPYSDHITAIEYQDGIENSNKRHWRNLRFVEPYPLPRENPNRGTGGRSTKNILHEHFGHLLGPWHEHCLIELVVETKHDFFEPTEKTVKPLRAGMPFVMVASKKFLYTLRKMGFQTFHPYIDESYDLENDWQRRTEMAIRSMFKFLRHPNNMDKIRAICKHNQNTMLKIGMHDPVLRTAKKLKHLISF